MHLTKTGSNLFYLHKSQMTNAIYFKLESIIIFLRETSTFKRKCVIISMMTKFSIYESRNCQKDCSLKVKKIQLRSTQISV